MTRIALIGVGAVAAIHARQLRAAGATPEVVCGVEEARTKAFAAAHGFARVATDLGAAFKDVDAAIIASPSPLHFDQALHALKCRVPVLVEMPACASSAEAERLGTAAAEAKVALQCAHTARYTEPHRRIGDWIRTKRLGDIHQITYFRGTQLNPRTWVDDALLHHAAHPIDLLIHWFPAIRLAGCVASMAEGAIHEVAVLANLPGGGPATVGVSYTARPAGIQMTVVGSLQTLRTDGFGFLELKDGSMDWQGAPQASYEQAICDQDRAFLECCRKKTGAIPWAETARLTDFLSRARKLSGVV